jgi:hypothetical protein
VLLAWQQKTSRCPLQGPRKRDLPLSQQVRVSWGCTMGSIGEILWLIFLLGLLGAGPGLVFVWLIRRRRLPLARALLAVVALASVAMALNLTYGIGVGIFGGAFSCLVLPAVGMSLIAAIATRASTWRLARGDPARRRLYLVGAVLIPLLQLAPLPGEITIVAACDALNRSEGDAIVRALHTYRQDHDAYPDTLQALVPGYLLDLPTPHCIAPFGWFHKQDVYDWMPGSDILSTGSTQFELERCTRERATLLTLPSIRFEFIQRHNLDTGSWSRVSFLDGVCSYLN